MSVAHHHHLTPAALEMIGVEEPRHENSVQERTVQCLENSVPPNMRTVVVDDVHIISVKCLIVTPVSCNIRSNIHHSINIFCIIEQWRWRIIIVNIFLLQTGKLYQEMCCNEVYCCWLKQHRQLKTFGLSFIVLSQYFTIYSLINQTFKRICYKVVFYFSIKSYIMCLWKVDLTSE